MDNDTYNRIAEELRTYLNREPTDNEIMNGQNDHLIMGRVRDKKDLERQASIENLQVAVDNPVTNKVVQ